MSLGRGYFQRGGIDPILCLSFSYKNSVLNISDTLEVSMSITSACFLIFAFSVLLKQCAYI